MIGALSTDSSANREGGRVSGLRAGGATDETPRVYVACLAAYNNGYLHGRWIEAAQPAEDLWEAVQTMLAASPIPQAEEFAIHDYEGFGRAPLSEYTPLEQVSRLADFVCDHGEDLAGMLLEHFGGDLESAQAAFEDYAGCYDSLASFAEELQADCGEPVPERLARYIDYDAMARDMEMSGDVFTLETGPQDVHVFWSH